MAQTFGERIIFLRKQKSWSQKALARQAGIPTPTLNALEKGTRDGNRVNVDTAKRLARTLGVSLDYLTGMYDEQDRDQPSATRVP